MTAELTLPAPKAKNFFEITPNATERQLRETLQVLLDANESNNWYVGDLLVALEKSYINAYRAEYGEDANGTKKAAQEAKAKLKLLTDGKIAPGTMDNIKYVCANFPATKRFDLSMSHHIAALGAAKKDVYVACKYLAIAKAENLSEKALRARMKADLTPERTDEPVTLHIDVEMINAMSALGSIELFLTKGETNILQLKKTYLVSRLEELLALAKGL